MKNRPRIPTPDVSKEVVDKDSKILSNITSLHCPVSSAGVTLMQHHIHTAYPTLSAGDVPVVQVVLSPIQELDGTGSVNNTLHANQPGTAALAQAVLSPGLGPVLTTTPVSVPMTVSQLTSLGLTSVHNSPLLARSIIQSNQNPTFIQAFEQIPPEPSAPPLTPTHKLTLTEVAPEDDQPVSSRCSNDSEMSQVSKESNESNTTTVSVSSKKSLEAPEQTSNHLEMSSLTPSASAPNSLSSMGGNGSNADGTRSRKISVVSQGATPAKRGEVYV